MKKELINYTDNRIKSLRKSLNKLDDEAAAAVNETIDQLTALKDKLSASEEEFDAKSALDAMKQSIDEKIEAMAEKINNNPNEPVATENWLTTSEAAHEFCNAIRNSRNAEQFNSNWGRKLSENGITFTTSNDPNYLPDVVRGKITDAWTRARFLGDVKKVNAKAYAVRYQSATQTDETSRAKGHNGATNSKKVEMTLNFVSKKVTPQMVYTRIDLANMTIFNDDNSLMDYIAETLVAQWMWEVEHAMIVGDGREDSDAKQITSIESIVRASTDAFVTVSTSDGSSALLDELVDLVSNINTEDGNDIVLLLTKSNINAVRKYVASATASSVYVSKADIAEMIGVARIEECSYLGTNLAVAFRPSKYVMIGEFEPAFTMQEDIDYNVTKWRYEAAIGGAVEGLKSAAVLLPHE